jgi:ABC-type uncharacterized transport system substrate-binding protein
MRRFLTLAACLPLVLAPLPASAHPHVFVTMQTELLYDDAKSLTGFKQKWTFDELYSSFAVQGLDKDGDGKFSREELQPLADVNVQSLSEFGYFTFPTLGGQKLEIQQPKDYWNEVNPDGTVTLYFTSLLVKPVSAAELKAFSFSIYDPTVYVSFSFTDIQPVKQTGAPPACAPKLKAPKPAPAATTLGEAFFSNLDASSTYGVQFAQTVVIECGN